MVTSDQTHINPADYFAPDATPYQEPHLITKYFLPVFVPSIFLATVFLRNRAVRRPPYSGIQNHIIAVASGIFVGNYCKSYVQKKTNRRYAMIYDYITKHPEDFQPIERVKYKDILETFIPGR